MNCETCHELLPEYQEDALPIKTSEDVREHLEACAECRRQQFHDASLLDAARALPRHAPGTEVMLRISKRIHGSAPAPRRTDYGPVLDITELSEYLHIEPSVLGLYIDEIPHFEMGGRLLFRRTTVERWIEAREQGSFITSYRIDVNTPNASSGRSNAARFTFDSDIILKVPEDQV